MKKLVVGFLAALVLLFGSVVWSHAGDRVGHPVFVHRPFVHHAVFVHHPFFVHRPFPHHHFVRSRVFIGADFFFFPPVFFAPPVVLAPGPPVYVQPPPQQPAYWYYCQSAKTYYPYVQQCPEGWLQVVPRPPAP